MNLRNEIDTIISRPHPVFMLGFRSTTVDMQHAGWELCCEQDIRHFQMYLVARHDKTRMLACSSPISYERILYHRGWTSQESLEPFVFTALRSGIEIRSYTQPSGFNRFAIDAFPEMRTEEVKRIEDLFPFKRIEHSQDIIVDQNDVSAIMEQILKAQSPRQAEIRDRVRKQRLREGEHIDAIKPSDTIHAQIITLREAA